ncbi:MAG TPA: response regulator [Ktedonobacterales bacterium]|nr:response regulator [Ktedonobacterales bacterium]
MVLLDMNMPGMDGLAVLEAVAAEEQLARRHAFVLVTAYEGRTLPLKLATLLAELHIPILSKPFDLDALLAVVRQAEHRLVE